jgi:hypothetical protein
MFVYQRPAKIQNLNQQTEFHKNQEHAPILGILDFYKILHFFDYVLRFIF